MVYVCTHVPTAHTIALARLLLQDKRSNTAPKVYVKNPRCQLWSTDTSVWNFHDGIVRYDPSEEFLNIKT